VIAFRDVVHLQLNYIQRQYVAKNVSCCERGQGLWRATLTEWMLNGFSPKNVLGMVKFWENQFFGAESARFQEYITEADAAEVRESDAICGVLFS
jgi:hypothetical protein